MWFVGTPAWQKRRRFEGTIAETPEGKETGTKDLKKTRKLALPTQPEEGVLRRPAPFLGLSTRRLGIPFQGLGGGDRGAEWCNRNRRRKKKKGPQTDPIMVLKATAGFW